jgi:hypothetical protein
MEQLLKLLDKAQVPGVCYVCNGLGRNQINVEGHPEATQWLCDNCRKEVIETVTKDYHSSV